MSDTATAPMPRKTGVLVGWYTEGQYTRRVEIKVELRNRSEGLELAIQSTAGRAFKVTGASPRAGEFRYTHAGDPFDYAGGQARDEVRAVTRFAPGWDAAKRDELVRVWDRWHLNGMRAACEHQRARGETWQTHPEAECPDCGYRLGSAWLYEPLPEDVVAFVRSL